MRLIPISLVLFLPRSPGGTFLSSLRRSAVPRVLSPATRLAMIFLLGVLILPAAALAQRVGPKVLEDRPKAWETETTQAGGHGTGNYKFVGALRCKNAGEAIVGVRILRSEVVDALQIGCAPIECAEDAECKWDKLERGAGAGQANPNANSAIAVCAHDQAIAGYRARVKQIKQGGSYEYVADLQFECARITGPKLGFGDGGPEVGVPVAEQRAWLSFSDSAQSGSTVEGGGTPTPRAESPWPIEQHCARRAASAVSVAVGKYVTTGSQVIQALSLFCVQAPPLVGGTPQP